MNDEAIRAVFKLAENCVVKTLKVDLETGYVNVLHLDKGEVGTTSPLLSDWIKHFTNNELIHPDYKEAFESLFSVEYMKKYLSYRKYLHLKYKRIGIDGNYKWYVATAIKADDDNVYIIIYLIDEN